MSGLQGLGRQGWVSRESRGKGTPCLRLRNGPCPSPCTSPRSWPCPGSREARGQQAGREGPRGAGHDHTRGLLSLAQADTPVPSTGGIPELSVRLAGPDLVTATSCLLPRTRPRGLAWDGRPRQGPHLLASVLSAGPLGWREALWLGAQQALYAPSQPPANTWGRSGPQSSRETRGKTPRSLPTRVMNTAAGTARLHLQQAFLPHLECGLRRGQHKAKASFQSGSRWRSRPRRRSKPRKKTDGEDC